MLRFLLPLLLLVSLHSYGQEEVPVWKIDYDSANLYWNTNISASIRLLQRAERVAFNDLGIYDENYLAILNAMGLAYRKTKDYKKAVISFEKNVAIRKEFSEQEDDATLHVMSNLASAYVLAGNEARAKKVYWHILEKSNQLKLSEPLLVASDELLLLYEGHEQYDTAHLLITSALMAPFSNTTADRYLSVRLAEARILRKEKKFAEATKSLAALNTDLQHSSAPIMDAVKLENSLMHMDEGLYLQAERELIALYRKLKSSPSVNEGMLTELTNGLGYTYEKLGIYDKAMAYYLESMNRCVAQYGYNSIGCILLQNNIAGIHLKMGRTGQAINQYEEFIKTFLMLSPEKSNAYLSAVSNLATAYRQNGNYNLALEYFNEVYKTLSSRRLLEGDLAATVMNNMAVTYIMKGEYLLAASYFEKVIRIRQALYGSESPLLFDVSGNLAVAYWMLKRYEEALPLFQKSLALGHREMKYVYPHLTEEEQVQFYQKQKQNFERFNSMCIQNVKTHPALLTTMFENQLLLKSIQFFTNKKRSSVIEAGSDQHLKTLMKQIDSKGAQLGQYYQLPLKELTALGISLTALESEIDALEKEICLALPGDQPPQRSYTWNDVQRSLLPQEALIEIIRFRKYDAITPVSATPSKQVSIGFTDSIYYAGLITTRETMDHPQLVLLKNGNHMETRNLSYYRNTLRFDIEDSISYPLYWKPFEDAIAGKTSIYVSNDGVYHQLNPAAFRDGKHHFVLEKVNVYSLMNARQLVDRKSKGDIDLSKAVLFGDASFQSTQADLFRERDTYFPLSALPGTRAELKGIARMAKLVSSPSNTFTGMDANEVNLKRVQQPSVLHIATHGFFSSDMVYVNEQMKDDFLFHSGIILSPASDAKKGKPSSEVDGIITAYDVLQMNLANTRLVVLSACDTGLGKVENGEGVHGLQRSFLQAGADEVMVSLWKVDDEKTQQLMNQFYGYLSQHHSSRESLRMAQLDMMKQNSNPRHWAAFVIVGGN